MALTLRSGLGRLLTPDEVDANFLGLASGANFNSSVTFPGSVTVTGTLTAALLVGALGGHLLFSSDNTYDIGAAGATRPRTGYFGTSLVSPKFDTEAGTSHLLGSGSRDALRIIHSAVVGDGITISSVDSTGSATFEPLVINADGLTLQAEGASAVQFTTGGASRVQLNTNGHMLWNTDNAIDIGASGANRPRTGYFGTSVVTPTIGTGAASGLSLTTSGGTQMQIQHIASAANFAVIQGAAAGNAPFVYSNGSDTNVGLALGTKGTGSTRFYTDVLATPLLQCEISHTGSANRYLIFTGSNGGNPTISTSAGDLMFGANLVVSKTGGGISLNDTSGTNQTFVLFSDNGTERWRLISEGNIADDFLLWNNTRAVVDVRVEQSTGNVSFLGATIVQNSQSTAYTLVLSDANKHILHPSADTTARTFTIPANSSVAYRVGTAITFVNQNGAGVLTIAITTDTMRLAGAGTLGSRTLAANGVATALKVASTEWIISGTGLT